MDYHAPADCPVCSQPMEISRLRCRNCNTELSGQFMPCRFCRLSDKHMQFVETFLRCRGSIKEVEKALGISYPTVRNMMEAALTALGLSDKNSPGAVRREEKEEILNRLSREEIGVEEAIAALNNMRGAK